MEQNKSHTKMKKIYVIILTLGILFLISFSISKIDYTPKAIENRVAVIPITGAITTEGSSDFFSGEGASSTAIVEFIKKANEDNSIKGIILEINSPGGGVVASAEIAKAVKQSKKPVVSWIREVGASGAYWIASSSDAIVAAPMSITGSIGVISSYLEFGGFLQEHNVTYQRLVAGKYKDAGSPYTELTEEERILFQAKLDNVYDYFVSDVAHNRDLEKEEVEELATGMFYLGVEAKDLNLIDYLGDKDTAVQVMEQLTETDDLQLVHFQKKKSLFEMLAGVNAMSSFYIGKGIGSEFTKKIDAEKAFQLNAKI